MQLVTLRQAKDHLNLPVEVTTGDAMIRLKLEAAHETVLDYIKQRRDDDNGLTWAATVDAWTEATAPARVKEAILLMFGDFYRGRGDDDPTGPARSMPGESADDLPPGVTRLLKRLRDPALA